jgi:two-component system cell cycle response regulator DivK
VKRIAVVEDNADNRLLLDAMLSGRYELTEYENGPDALAGIDASVPDLVLLDISLPGMDGIEVFSRLRAEPATATLPVIALTAHAMGGDRELFLAMGFDGYVSKPIVDEGVLIDAIERHLRSPIVLVR